jgi:hypothetical protein
MHIIITIYIFLKYNMRFCHTQHNENSSQYVLQNY